MDHAKNWRPQAAEAGEERVPYHAAILWQECLSLVLSPSATAGSRDIVLYVR